MTAPAPEASGVHLNAPVIRFAMRILGWSQGELARRVDVHEATISRALNGQATSHRLAEKLREAFGRRLALEEIVLIPEFSPGLPGGAQDVGYNEQNGPEAF